MARSIPLPSLSTLALLLVLTVTTTTTFNPSLVDACGVTIHNEVAFRASCILLSAKQDNNNSTRLVTPPHQTHSYAPSYSHSLLHLNTNHTFTSTSLQDDYTPLLEQRDLLLAGSFFPDWGYNCIGKLYNEAAEEVITLTKHVYCDSTPMRGANAKGVNECRYPCSFASSRFSSHPCLSASLPFSRHPSFPLCPPLSCRDDNSLSICVSVSVPRPCPLLLITLPFYCLCAHLRVQGPRSSSGIRQQRERALRGKRKGSCYCLFAEL